MVSASGIFYWIEDHSRNMVSILKFACMIVYLRHPSIESLFDIHVQVQKPVYQI